MNEVCVRFPFDRTLEVGRIPLAGPGEVEEAIHRAAEAFPARRRQAAHERAEVLQRAAALIAARKDALAQTLCLEAGKPITLARGEVDRAAATFTFAADETRRAGGEALDLGGAPTGVGRTAITRRVPRGPVAAITPFNFPLNLAAHKIAPALAVGAPVVHKPALETPLSALALRDIVALAGAGPAALQVLPCSDADAAPLVEDARLPVLSFTGSADAGWRLKARAPRKQVILELGGNAAVIVEPDADGGAAARRIATAAFAYAGQVCIKAQRVLVHETIAAPFTEAFVDAARAVRCGDPRASDVLCGPLIRPRDADRIMAWIAEAEAQGARRLCGGERHGDLVTPCVLAAVPHEARVWAEEVFGPVAVVQPYRDFAEALRLTNASRYGLQAGVFTSDIGKILHAFAELEVGAVIHGDAPVFRSDQMPYGGSKDSGFGREGVRSSMDEMTELRLLVLRA